jgi:citrate synthase
MDFRAHVCVLGLGHRVDLTGPPRMPRCKIAISRRASSFPRDSIRTEMTNTIEKINIDNIETGFIPVRELIYSS